MSTHKHTTPHNSPVKCYKGNSLNMSLAVLKGFDNVKTSSTFYQGCFKATLVWGGGELRNAIIGLLRLCIACKRTHISKVQESWSLPQQAYILKTVTGLLLADVNQRSSLTSKCMSGCPQVHTLQRMAHFKPCSFW